MKFPPARTLASVLAVAIAVGVGLVLQQQQHPQQPESSEQTTARRDRFLRVYDSVATQLYGSNGSNNNNCTSRLVEGRLGITQVYACGNPMHPPIVFLHGTLSLSSTALLWGDWTIPHLHEKYYTIAVDSPCLLAGRSSRKLIDPTGGTSGTNDNRNRADGNGNTEYCSIEHDRDHAAEWIVNLVLQLGIVGGPVSLVGYGAGANLAAQVAMAGPVIVDKLVLISPVPASARYSSTFVKHPMYWICSTLYEVVGSNSSSSAWWRQWIPAAIPRMIRNCFYASLIADPNVKLSDIKHWDLVEASEDYVGAAASSSLYAFWGRKGSTKEEDDSVLEDMLRQVPTLLIVGQNDPVSDVDGMVERAQAVGVTHVKVYKNAGHLLHVENPNEDIVRAIDAFLSSEPKQQREAAAIAAGGETHSNNNNNNKKKTKVEYLKQSD
jgi:pimeloyl-ACP methyl ester carboxylesterase